MNISCIGPFYLKTRVSFKYFENDWSLSVIASLVYFSCTMHTRDHCVKRVHISCYSVPYSVRMWKNADQNNSEYGHFYVVDVTQIKEIYFKIKFLMKYILNSSKSYFLLLNMRIRASFQSRSFVINLNKNNVVIMFNVFKNKLLNKFLQQTMPQ